MDQEYGCKYCDKAFSNKQALGGHQNAHKLQRSIEKMEKAALKSQRENFIGPKAYSGPPYLGPHNLSCYFFNRSPAAASFPQSLLLARNAFPQARPGNMFPGWSASRQRGVVSQPIYPNLSGFAAENDDESGLDLTLKL